MKNEKFKISVDVHNLDFEVIFNICLGKKLQLIRFTICFYRVSQKTPLKEMCEFLTLKLVFTSIMLSPV